MHLPKIALLVALLAPGFQDSVPDHFKARYGTTFDSLSAADRANLVKFEELAYKYLAAPDNAKEGLRDQIKALPAPPLSAVKTILRRGAPAPWPALTPGAVITRKIKV